MDVYHTLLSEIAKLPVIDTHEHLPWDEKSRSDSQNDVLSEYLSCYLSSDILSSGLSRADYQKVVDPKGDILKRWEIVEPFWDFSRYTGYGQALDHAANGIYGVEGIHKHTIEELNALFLAGKKEGHFHKVLKELCNIETSLLDVWSFHFYPGDHPFFQRIWQPMYYIMPVEPPEGDTISLVENTTSIPIKSLDNWLEALESDLDLFLNTYGVRVLKNAMAYERTLRFEKVSYAIAKDLFAQALDKREKATNQEDRHLLFPHELQDFMMHYVLTLANKRNLTYQIHTGLLEGNGNILSNSDPSLLNNLFAEYPNVDFDLFHIGYPYQGTACALAKMFPNVFVDMCWAHIISPSASVLALDDFLDAIPFNKISAFGGDYGFVDGVYGHLLISKQNVSRTLAQKVARGVFDEGKALEIAKALYYDNPKRIFKL